LISRPTNTCVLRRRWFSSPCKLSTQFCRSKCGCENPDSRQFCSDCGTPFGSRCPKCSAENPVGKKFCGDCGTALANKASIHIATTHTVETPAPEIRMRPEQLDASATADGERKTITALFADIKGSTELMRDLDPEEARAIVDPLLQLMMAAVHRYGGYVAQSTGDGIFALFGAPVAHETARTAPLTGLLLQRTRISFTSSSTGSRSVVAPARRTLPGGCSIREATEPNRFPGPRRSASSAAHAFRPQATCRSCADLPFDNRPSHNRAL
jgi:class 3 adenylate cyclase